MQLPRVWIVGLALALLVVAGLFVVFSPSASSTDSGFSESSRNTDLAYDATTDLNAIHPSYLFAVKDGKFRMPSTPKAPLEKFNIRSRMNYGNCLGANMLGTAPVYIVNCANDVLWQAQAYSNNGANFYNPWQRQYLGVISGGGELQFNGGATRADVYQLDAKSHSNDWHAFQLRQVNFCIDGTRPWDIMGIGSGLSAKPCADTSNFFFEFRMPDASEKPVAQQMLNGFFATMSCVSTITATIGACTAGEVVTVGADTLACAGAALATPAGCSALLKGAVNGGNF